MSCFMSWSCLEMGCACHSGSSCGGPTRASAVSHQLPALLAAGGVGKGDVEWGTNRAPPPGPTSYRHIPGLHRCPFSTHEAGLCLQGGCFLGQQLPATLAHVPGGVGRVQYQGPGGRMGG